MIVEQRDIEVSELERLVEARTHELSAFSTHLQSLAEQEKSQLARTLHDELGGLLTAAKMDLSWLQSRLSPGQEKPVQDRLAQLGSVLDEAMDLKRRIVEQLRPSLLEHFGLATAIRAHVEATCAQAGLECEVLVEHPCDSLSKDMAIGLFRAVQEGLSNILRHARCRRVELVLGGNAAQCMVTLTDDGQGFDSSGPQITSSHGLMRMRQRIHALGGSMSVESRAGAGTTLRFGVPLPHES
ncbi:MAG TPA: sensor histidine kinase [Steroidobacteraceae bacterium]|nr:sensor histidine kinase [Steroidobacteraceae bacterium]